MTESAFEEGMCDLGKWRQRAGAPRAEGTGSAKEVNACALRWVSRLGDCSLGGSFWRRWEATKPT